MIYFLAMLHDSMSSATQKPNIDTIFLYCTQVMLLG